MPLFSGGESIPDPEREFQIKQNIFYSALARVQEAIENKPANSKLDERRLDKVGRKEEEKLLRRGFAGSDAPELLLLLLQIEQLGLKNVSISMVQDVSATVDKLGDPEFSMVGAIMDLVRKYEHEGITYPKF